MFCRPANRFWPALIVATSVAISQTACSKAPARAEERVAVLPFENLTSDPTSAWMSRALGVILAARSDGGQKWQAFASPGVHEAQLARATQIVQGYLTVERGVLRVYATVRDEGHRRNVKSLQAEGSAARLLDITTDLARQLAPSVRDYTTQNAEAVRELFSGRPLAAKAADPGYGLAHLQLVEMLARKGEQQELKAAIDTARGARFTAAERAQFDLIAAQISGDHSARIAALTRLATATPGDPQLWRAVADQQLQAKDYRSAADSFARVLAASPEDQNTLNLRGYALMFAGDFEGAVKSLEEYRRLAPNLANPMDSLGEVHFYFGRYADAARYFQEAHEKDPRAAAGFEPFRAALSTFLAGDVAKADQEMERFLTAAAKADDELVSVRRVQWFRLTGRKPDLPKATSMDLAVSALWNLFDGQRDQARELAESARRSAALPTAVAFSSSVLLLCAPSAPPEVWEKRIATALAQPEQAGFRKQLLGYALLLDKRYAEAAKLWRDAYASAGGLTSGQERLLLAWALSESGGKPEALRLLTPGFLPPPVLDTSPGILAYAKAIALRPRPQ